MQPRDIMDEILVNLIFDSPKNFLLLGCSYIIEDLPQ